MYGNFFQLGPLPPNIISGSYAYHLVILSYFIAVFASFLALNMASQLRPTISKTEYTLWLLGGAFSMGAGICLSLPTSPKMLVTTPSLRGA